MYRIATALILVGLLALGIGMLFPGGAADYVRVDPEEWLDAHEEAAEQIADEFLAGNGPDTVAVPAEMECKSVRRFDDAVVFTFESGGLWKLDRGVCFSPSESEPALGIGEEPPVTWRHLRGSWYYWAAE